MIKVEPVGTGDPLRKWRMLRNGTSVWWEVQSRNKRSVELDLRSEEGQSVDDGAAIHERAWARENAGGNAPL